MATGRTTLALAAAASLALASACGSGSEQAVTHHSSSPTHPDPTASAFDGSGYRFTAPAGWFSKAAAGDWNTGVSPAKYAPGFDTFTSRVGDPWIVIGQRPVAAGVPLDRWVDRMAASRTITYPRTTCLPPEHVGRTALGGQPARVRSFHCPVDGPKAVAVQVLTVHRNRGFVAMCYSEESKAGPLPDFETVCNEWLRNFRLLT